MKIAVCFSGMMRHSSVTAEYIKNKFKEFNVDYFVHTWSENTNRSVHPDSEFVEQYCIDNNIDFSNKQNRKDAANKLTITPDNSFNELKKTNEVFNFVKTEVESFSKYKELCWKYKVRQFIPLWYSWWKSIKLKQQVENQYGFKYDVVIKMRFDLLLPDTFIIEREIENINNDPRSFYSLDVDHKKEHTTDILFAAKNDLMNFASDYHLNCDMTNGREGLYKYLKRNNIDVKKFVFDSGTFENNQKYTLYRPEFDDLDIVHIFNNTGKFYFQQEKYKNK
jgi:hypothetical protein